jgi:hypothetical protein
LPAVAEPSDLPLTTLLSQALVAFTIEFDNTVEQRMPHRTATDPTDTSRTGPWLISQAMWANFLRLVDEDGAPLGALAGPVRMTNLDGMRRWGYVTVAPAPDDTRAKPPKAAWVVKPTPAGLKAQAVSGPLAAEIETRWAERFGRTEIAALSAALAAIRRQLPPGQPAYLPVARFGLRTEPPALAAAPPDDLSALLSAVLLAFTLDFERGWPLSLPIAQDVLRVLAARPVPVRDLPRLSGVSKEAIAMGLGFLARSGRVQLQTAASGRGKAASLTARGLEAKTACEARLTEIEAEWRGRYADQAIDALRAPLERLCGPGDDGRPRLFAGLKPPPQSWRARLPRPAILPHHPMVLHRGGYPDGA